MVDTQGGWCLPIAEIGGDLTRFCVQNRLRGIESLDRIAKELWDGLSRREGSTVCRKKFSARWGTLLSTGLTGYNGFL